MVERAQKGKRFWEIMGYPAVVVTITVGSIQIDKDVVFILPSPETEDKANDKNIIGQSDRVNKNEGKGSSPSEAIET